jgi:hypothetical protein
MFSFCLLRASTAAAQLRTTGQIVGTVHDSSNATVPNAPVEVTDLATGMSAMTTGGDRWWPTSTTAATSRSGARLRHNHRRC